MTPWKKQPLLYRWVELVDLLLSDFARWEGIEEGTSPFLEAESLYRNLIVYRGVVRVC